MLKGLIEGRMVHYVLAAHDLPKEFAHRAGEHRAAIVVNSWEGLGRDDGYANLTVLMDWTNDGAFSRIDYEQHGQNVGVPAIWATSRTFSEDKEPGTWHWIEGSNASSIEYVTKSELTELMAGDLEGYVSKAEFADMVAELVKKNALL